MLGFEFDSNSQPYSIDNLGEAVGVFVFEIIQAFILTSWYKAYMLIVGILGVSMNVSTLFFDFKPRYRTSFHPNPSIRKSVRALRSTEPSPNKKCD
jgi:hypothetical protein